MEAFFIQIFLDHWLFCLCDVVCIKLHHLMYMCVYRTFFLLASVVYITLTYQFW